MPLTHREQRVYFTRLTCELVLWINKVEWSEHAAWAQPNGPGSEIKVECAIDEWTVHNPRMVKVGTQIVMAQDRVHNPKGLHPQGLAVDLLIYINGEYITDGSHPIWKIIDEYARGMDPEFGLGIDFNDANHLSYGEGT